MRPIRISPPLVLALLVLVGCETVPMQERAHLCRTVDWFEYGRNDGFLGLPLGERSALFADCRRFGYAPDLAAYQAGRTEGLLRYCTVESGYRAGREGRRYADVCPPDLEIAFLQGYREGRRAREARHGSYWGPGLAPRYYPYYPHRHYRRDRDRDDDGDRPDEEDDELIPDRDEGEQDFPDRVSPDRDVPDQEASRRQPEREREPPDTDWTGTVWPDTRDEPDDRSDFGRDDDRDEREVEVEREEREEPEIRRESGEGD
jgi:hypothetical protein